MYKPKIVCAGIFFGLQLIAFILRDIDDGTPSNIMFYLALPFALITFDMVTRFLKRAR